MANQTIYPYGTGGSLPADVGIVNDLITGGADKALSAEMGKELGDALGKTTLIESSFTGFTHFKDGYQLKANDAQIGVALADVPTSSDSGCKNVKIPVSDYSIAEYIQYSSGYEFGSLFVDANDVVVKVSTRASGTAQVATSVSIPSNATYFVYSYYPASSYNKSVTLYTADGIYTKLKESGSTTTGGSTVTVTASAPKLTDGQLNSNGDIVTGNYVTTETIFGEFFLELNDNWRVYEGHLYDRNGKMVSYQYIHPSVSHTGMRGQWTSRKFMSTNNAIPEFGYRLTFCKADQSAIGNNEQPVKTFVIMADSGLHRWIPDDLPNYDVALRRIDYIQRLCWLPLAKVPNGYSESGQPMNAANIYYCLAGQRQHSVPYSDVADTRTYVPNNVSLRTFMTATKNKRSLLYTEELGQGTSKYGMSYTTGHRRCYYGEVCCGFTGWVMGMDTMYLATGYHTNIVPGLSTVTYNSVNDLRPLDLIWQEGHISIITDIYKDDFGNVKFVVWGEMSTPYIYRTIYTPELFDTRMVAVSGEVHRWTGWETLPEPPASEYSQYLLGQTRKEPEWGGEIMCFAGDYAAFTVGSTIYLNARRNSVYTGVELYKDDVLLQTIDITGLSADGIYNDGEDWVKVNLTTLNLGGGKYKARLTDGTNTSDYTYFEVIDITISATKSGNSVIVNFSSTNALPVSIEQVKENGFPKGDTGKFHVITAEEVAAGTMTLPWAYNSTYKYLLMLIRGDYGTTAKKILQPSS